ncbi:TPA: indolepyruvate ferredoxin oxidoreductase family protein [Burkholderia vietnamiensis]|uniref:indolepyruvate ferredoxin oxidoreductase family protein n=1 Tax=Burkholderia vietnamiensis TaxID=60552 RepID=UPI001B9FC169|nr:indolepyruvate ferredoxin oxidoreductase family protein [Burkholderia vietnamiensis]MBR7912938.1 indolepyruvate ferredoxin oxidoreductase family protein [Burkholderia vietnamiensis]HDR9275999.1 indolepyruvate ferredoxin oxidoreductase family protein [Burkholderia vietnamiensis]
MSDGRLTATAGRVYLSGVQALVRLTVVQQIRDAAAGLATAGFVSGYRGSPLGGLDLEFVRAREELSAHAIRFQPGVNEELAATAVWGTQQVDLVGESRYDGVFALWYGKGPGVDRSVDVLKHMNYAGTSANGGVLLVAGDDHGAYSSTLPHQSDHVFSAAMIPVLYPCNVAEYIELGLHGFAMSRYSGCAVGFKALADTVESSASVDADPFSLQIRIPEDHVLPEGGLNCRASSASLGAHARTQEWLTHQHKYFAVLAYGRANRLNRIVVDAPHARIGIVASGKSYSDVCEALTLLDLADSGADAMVRLFKVAMPWPLEPEGLHEFAHGLDEIIVVEEKRPIVEPQIRTMLYDWPEGLRPSIYGKGNECGAMIDGDSAASLSSVGDFSVLRIARVIAERLERVVGTRAFRSRLDAVEPAADVIRRAQKIPTRAAYYCSGCPHNTSTRVPSGSIALAGIGCHVMATSIYPEHNRTFTQMGGEGATWIGQAPFSRETHVFANLGDGTYFHSGYLAIRAAVAAGARMTYKILYNDAVAMTGGQSVDGTITVQDMTRQLAAEGVRKIAVVTDDMTRYASRDGLAAHVTIHPRDAFDDVQRALRDFDGVSVLIYDQVCAAEKRRRVAQGKLPAPQRRAFINSLVCEDCGDCGKVSNCSSIVPVRTPLGRKRAINQTSCNHDLSCTKGFCPSFVTVVGAATRKRSARAGSMRDNLGSGLPAPALPAAGASPFNILVCGIGGTGVITIGALLGRAAHLEGKGVSVLDMTGMSQKNGAVMCHVRIADTSGGTWAQRIPAGHADLMLGCDMLTAASPDAIERVGRARTRIALNAHEQPPGYAAQLPDWQFPRAEVEQLLTDAAAGGVAVVDATTLAMQQLGDEMLANVVMLGYAWQRGWIPLSDASLQRAIELNGVAVDRNRAAFALGRRAAAGESDHLAPSHQTIVWTRAQPLDDLIARHSAFLAAYQHSHYAARYRDFVERVRVVERAACGRDTLTRTVADNLFRLMAYKDEYEVARLYVDPAFRTALDETFDGKYTLRFHFAPPALSFWRRGATATKLTFGPWFIVVLRVLAACRVVRGTWLDPFGHTAERKWERRMIDEYMAGIEEAVAMLDRGRHQAVIELARLPEQIRGYGHVKAARVRLAWQSWHSALSRLTGQPAHADVAPNVTDDVPFDPLSVAFQQRSAS